MDFVNQILQAIAAAFGDVVGRFLTTLPALFAALIIIILGWIVAALVARGLTRLLRTVRFNELAQRAGIEQFLERAQIKLDPSGALAALVKWFIILLFLVAAANTLGWPQVSQFLNQILAYLPNVAVAVIILIVGLALAGFIRDMVRGTVASAGAAERSADVIAGATYWLFAIITALTALNQLGIAITLSETLYVALFGSIAAILALAFGLGGRALAGDLVAGWSLSTQLGEGDEVTIGEDQGTVVRVGPTSTVIKTKQKEIILPNSAVAQSRIVR
ncbi:MAG: mechanosensitive ion channel [Chloroflexi bacterium]|nr:mechanosensitive ion channel [Chloroflexota bacterium]